MRTRNPGQGGFTLIELMVVVAIAAVVLGLAVPSFSDFIDRSRAISATNDLVLFFNYGRSEAIKRGEEVVLCRSNTGSGCTGGSWADGAIVFVDEVGGNEQVDGGSPGDPILRKLEALSSTVTVSGPQKVVFRPVGTAQSAAVFTVVAGDDSDMKRRVCVSGTGRVESKPYSEACS